MILVFWTLSFKPAFLLSSFTLFKRLFSFSPLSAVRVVSSAYLRLLIFLLVNLLPVCASSSQAFHMMYSACKLNKQGDNIQAWCTPFLILNQSVVPCPVLIVASCPAHSILRRCKNFPQFVVIHMVTGFSLFNGAEVDAFLEFPCCFSDSVTIANLISGSSAFSKSSLYLWKFLVFILLKPGFKDFEYYLASI